MEIGKLLLRIIQGALLFFLLISGIGSMPSVMGMLFLMLAVLATPRKILDFFLEDWLIRCILIGALLYYWGTIPSEDASSAGRTLHRQGSRFLSVLEKIINAPSLTQLIVEAGHFNSNYQIAKSKNSES